LSQSKRNPNLPPWLQDVPLPPQPPATGGAPLFSGLPEWLRDEDEAEIAPAAAAADVPSWLHPTPEPPDSGQPAPDWFSATGPAAPPQPVPPGVVPSDEPAPPSWLQSLRATITPDVEPEAAEEASGLTPFSLDDVTGAAAQPESPLTEGAETAFPSWLAETGAGDRAGDQPPVTDAAPLASEGPMESWLDTVAEPEQPADLPSWLRELPATEPAAAPAPPVPQAGAEELPAWLRNVAPAEPPASPAEAPTSDLPEWLRVQEETAPAGPPPVARPPTDELPAWLREISSDTGKADAASTGADLPDWLRDASISQPVPIEPPPAPAQPAPAPAAPAVLPPAEQLPDWLRDIAQPAGAAPAPEPPAMPPGLPGADLPDWLTSAAEVPSIAPVPDRPRDTLPAAPAAPADDLPEWLASLAAIPDTTPATSHPAPPPPATDLPDWLQSTIAPPAGGAAESLPPWLEDESGSPLPTADSANLPDWLRGAEIPVVTSEGHAAPARPAEPATPQAAGDLLGGMDLPAWLRAEPEPKPEMTPTDARTLDWLTRLGGPDEEAAVLSTATAPKLALPPAPSRTAAQREALALLNRLAAEPIPAAVPQPPAARASALQRIGFERLLSILLLVLLIVAIAIPGIAPVLDVPPALDRANALQRQIASLGENDVVLVGYEWDARRVGELRPLERAVIGQLIARRVKLVLLSTDPQGTLLQFDLLDTLRASGYRQQGEGFLLLGYKPGGEMALRALARDLQTVLRSDYRGDDATRSALVGGIDTGRPLTQLNDFSLILVLADDTPDVQGWMEQVYPVTRASEQPVPFSFLLPEEAAPIVQPYMRQPDVNYLAGRRGALAYAALDRDATLPIGAIASEAAQQRLASLLFVAVLLIGLAGSGITAVRRRRS